MYIVHVLRGKDWIHDSEWQSLTQAFEVADELSRHGSGQVTMVSREDDSSGYKPIAIYDEGSRTWPQPR